MPPSDTSPDSFLPLTPIMFQIMLALIEGERHGYAIMQNVAEQSGGLVKIGAGTLYTALKRMLAQGWIIESDARPEPNADDERRRYYRLTDFGQRILKAEAQRMEKAVEAARAGGLLGKPIAQPITSAGRA